MTWTRNNRIVWKNICILPILHNRVEFALEVRNCFQSFQPDAIAVEFPDTLKEKIIQGIKRLPLLSVVHYEERDGTFTYLLLEPTDPQVEAVRLAMDKHIPLHFIDRDTEGYPPGRSAMPDPYSLTKIGHYVYCQAYLRSHRTEDHLPEDDLREKTMAYYLQRLSEKAERILFVGGLYHFPGILAKLSRPQTEVIGRRQRKGVGLAHLHKESSREIMSEMPFFAADYERFRGKPYGDPPDRMTVNQALLKLARENHLKNSRETLTRHQLWILNRFARNCALLSGALVPSFYELVVASRSVADDNFAYEVWDEGSRYPWQCENPELPVLRLSGDDLFLDQKRIRFHRRLKTFRRRLVPVPVKKRIREKSPGEWKKSFKGYHICSYPPEDVVVEGYGKYLMKRALEIKSQENSRIVPFMSSMLDGLDIRQTIRDWHQGKIYVKENMPVKGKVGSVVVIFDPDHPEKAGKEAFPWKITWLGEHEQESDMSFYSTPAGEVMDGPGISRCHYGGFMLTYPPLRVYDVWKDPFFDTARNKPERLLMAAIDYSLEKHVVYVAAAPPSGWCQSLAAKLGKKIIYLPIGIFSPVALKQIRQFHVLDGYHVRRYARHYIA
jgi:hypothetical protein